MPEIVCTNKNKQLIKKYLKLGDLGIFPFVTRIEHLEWKLDFSPNVKQLAIGADETGLFEVWPTVNLVQSLPRRQRKLEIPSWDSPRK